MLAAGPLDRRITIQSRTITQAASGDPVETWATFATVWASKLDVGGSEQFQADQEQAEQTTVFRIRHRAGVIREMRITLGGIIYDIVDVAEIGKRDGMRISTVAQVT